MVLYTYCSNISEWPICIYRVQGFISVNKGKSKSVPVLNWAHTILGFHKRRGISWLAEWLLASEILCSHGVGWLVGWLVSQPVSHEDVWESGGIAPPILNIGSREVSCQLHTTVTLPRERSPVSHWIGSWVDPRANLDAVAKRKFLACQESKPRSSSP
jgi:hypothetical protein